MDDAKRKADYEKSANEYWRWKQAGDNLLIAATILEAEYKKGENSIKETERGTLPHSMLVLSQIIYLKAKSLELYLKAVYVKQGNIATDGNGNLSSLIKGHDLLKMSQLTKVVALDSDRGKFLNKLKDAIIFWGTYPIPLEYKYWRPNISGFTGIQPIYIWSDKDSKEIDDILDEAIKGLE